MLGHNCLFLMNGKGSRVWIDSGSSILIFTIGELQRILGASEPKLDALLNEDTTFPDYGTNPLKLIGTITLTLESIGWRVNARIKFIGGNRPSIISRDLVPQLGLQLVQQKPGDQIMSIDEEPQRIAARWGARLTEKLLQLAVFKSF